jgi:drug/metabolite transporter (DMT)-like permease
MRRPPTRRQAVLFLVIAAALWSSSGLLVKVLTWQPLSILSARSILATVVFLVYLRKPNIRWNWPQITGAFSYVAAQLLFITATKLTTAASAIFLQYTAPLYIGIFGYWLLREKPTRTSWLSMSFIFLGLLLFFGDKLSASGLYGNLIAILSGIALASLALCLRAQKAGSPAETILVGNVIGIVVGLPWLIRETVTPVALGIISYLGIFQIGLSFILYTLAVTQLPALESTLIITLEPILSPLWVFLLLHEAPGPAAIAGSIIVTAAVSFSAFQSARSGAAIISHAE